ncbi:MAG: hypothetical protein D6737_00320 [Chloroflexi bacterium]|nr:MAG: hypothetical protein D6737_00320 [Chloroflexota bacterium]
MILFKARLIIGEQRWLPSLDALKTAEAPFILFRVLVVAALIATILITFPLWQRHENPPMLPLLALPVIDLGVLLIASLLLVLLRPVLGMVIYTALMVYAMLIDQFRLQPEFFSLTLLLWGTLPNRNSRNIARAHLIALWIWAGLNKLLSPNFLHRTAQGLLHDLIPNPPLWIDDHAGYILALTEMGVGLLILYPRTRKISAMLAFGLHIGILITLSPLGRNWNQAVWPWNIALAFAGFVFVLAWREWSLREMLLHHRGVAIVVVTLMLTPVGFYFGLVDAYMAHNLYSSNVPRASSEAFSTQTSWEVFNVPTPPERRIYRQFFHLTCEPGDELRIRDERWWFRQRDQLLTQELCPQTVDDDDV